MRYVLLRMGDNRYVAKPGLAHSYTRKFEDACIFPTKENAIANKCGNERVMVVNGG
jgi:hypothetical protein